mgnify:FL=1
MAIRSTEDHVEALRPRVREYTPDELATMLASRTDVVVIDVREVQELIDLGVIPGSRHVPRGMLEFWADPAMSYYREFFSGDREIVVHCAAGQRSVLAAIALQDMGYPRVAHLAGGFTAWVAAGHPVEPAPAASKWARRP